MKWMHARKTMVAQPTQSTKRCRLPLNVSHVYGSDPKSTMSTKHDPHSLWYIWSNGCDTNTNFGFSPFPPLIIIFWIYCNISLIYFHFITEWEQSNSNIDKVIINFCNLIEFEVEQNMQTSAHWKQTQRCCIPIPAPFYTHSEKYTTTEPFYDKCCVLISRTYDFCALLLKLCNNKFRNYGITNENLSLSLSTSLYLFFSLSVSPFMLYSFVRMEKN